VIIIDQLIFDQLSPTLTKPKRLTKSSPPLYHQKNDNNTEYHPQKLRNQKTKAKDQKMKRKKNALIHTLFHLVVWLMCFFWRHIYTWNKIISIFSLLCYNSLNWHDYDTDCFWYLGNLENTCSLRFLSTTTNWLASSLQKETSRNKRNKQEW